MHGLTLSSLAITVLSEFHSTELLKSLHLQWSIRQYRSKNKDYELISMNSKFKQWWSWIPLISTKRTLFSHNNRPHWTHKRSRRTMLEINISENHTDGMGIWIVLHNQNPTLSERLYQAADKLISDPEQKWTSNTCWWLV